MRHLPLVFLVVLAACGKPADKSDLLPEREAARLLVDRNWLDVWPRSADERLHVFRFTPAMGGGVYQDRTLFAGQFELFRFHVEEDTLTFDLPHQRQRAKTSFKLSRVHGPHPF